MTIFGLQEIAASINEFADEEVKQTRSCPAFPRRSHRGDGADRAGRWLRSWAQSRPTPFRRSRRDLATSTASSALSPMAAPISSWCWRARKKARAMHAVYRCSWSNETRPYASAASRTRWAYTPPPPAKSNTIIHRPYLVGKRRFGLLRYAMALMNGARLAVGAQAMGIAEAAYREAYRYASERIQFGKPIRELPAVARMLLSMRGEIEAGTRLAIRDRTLGGPH